MCVRAVNKFNISFDVIKGVGFINIYLNQDLNGRNMCWRFHLIFNPCEVAEFMVSSLRL